MLSYLLIREKIEADEDDTEKFKQAMIAANPEYAAEIIKDFEAAETGEYAEPTEEPRGPLDASGLTEALEELKQLGIGLQND